MDIKKDIIKSFKWNIVDKLSTQSIQFIFGIILARVLSPNDFGIFSLLLLIISYIQVFIDSGFSKAIIQSQEKDNVVLSTVFYFNFFISLLTALLVFFNADILSKILTNKNISEYIAAIGGILIINAFLIIPTIILTMALDFKSLAKINFLSSLAAGITAIYLSLEGAGIWCLIINIYLKSFLSVVLMFFYSKWIPTYCFSKQALKRLYPFGSNLLASNVLNLTVNNLSTFFIGKHIGIIELGYYSRGTQFTDVFFSVFVSILDNTLLPTLSRIKDNIQELGIKITKIIQKIGFIIIPFYVLLITLAEPLVIVLLTDKWANIIPIIQLFSISRMISVISTVNINLLYILGKSNLVLRQQYFKVIIRIFILLITFKFGIFYIALGELINTIIAFFINSYYSNKIMSHGFFMQSKCLANIFLAATIMGGSVYIINEFINFTFFKLLFGGIIGFAIYIGLLYLIDKKFVTSLINQNSEEGTTNL